MLRIEKELEFVRRAEALRVDLDAEDWDRAPLQQVLRGNTTAMVEIGEAQRTLDAIFEGSIAPQEWVLSAQLLAGVPGAGHDGGEEGATSP